MLSVPLTNTSEFALLDDEDVDVALDGPWYKMPSGYVAASRDGARLLHRLVLGLAKGDGVSVDHRNHDPLDNRRDNLSPGSQRHNLQNRRSDRNASSRFVGVHFCKRTRKWVAQASLGGKHVHLGRFATEGDAASASEGFRREHYPGFIGMEI